MRFRMGLRWKKDYPTPQDFPNGKTALIIALCVFLILACICAVEYQNQAVAAEMQATERTKNLADCMNGTLRMTDADKTYAVACRKAEGFKI